MTNNEYLSSRSKLAIPLDSISKLYAIVNQVRIHQYPETLFKDCLIFENLISEEYAVLEYENFKKYPMEFIGHLQSLYFRNNEWRHWNIVLKIILKFMEEKDAEHEPR